MADHYHYLDSFYRSSCSPDGDESVDSGSTNFQYGFPPYHPSFGFGQAVASTSSACASIRPTQTPSHTVWFAGVLYIELIVFYLMPIHLCTLQVSLTGDENEKPVEECTYIVKVISAGYSSGYLVKNWEANTRFSTYSEIRDQLASDFATLLQEADDFHFGYIQRGHGVKGKQFTITDDQDVRGLYNEYRGRREIICG